jgi:hypothetical protein
MRVLVADDSPHTDGGKPASEDGDDLHRRGNA